MFQDNALRTLPFLLFSFVLLIRISAVFSHSASMVVDPFLMETKRQEEPAETSTNHVKGYVSAVTLRRASQQKLITASSDSVNPKDLIQYLQALRLEHEAERILNQAENCST